MTRAADAEGCDARWNGKDGRVLRDHKAVLRFAYEDSPGFVVLKFLAEDALVEVAA